MSLPARGVWIEIFASIAIVKIPTSLPARGVWIEIMEIYRPFYQKQSLPARGVWIEILRIRTDNVLLEVAPRKGGVD